MKKVLLRTELPININLKYAKYKKNETSALSYWSLKDAASEAISTAFAFQIMQSQIARDFLRNWKSREFVWRLKRLENK